MPLGPKELWAESVRRYEARRTDNYRRERIDLHLRMRRVRWDLGNEHDAALEALGYREGEQLKLREEIA